MLEEHVTRALARIHTDAICGEGRRLGKDGCNECLIFLGGDAGGTRGGPGRTGGGRTVGDDGARGGGDLELLRRELQDRGERCLVRDTQPAYAIGGET